MELYVLPAGSGDIPVLEKINEEAIPAAERNTLNDLMATGAEILGIRENHEPAGFMVTRKYRGILYLAYLAVRKDLRSKGIGGQALRELIRTYPDCQVIVEFEAPDGGSAADDINRRRKGFYLRNGFHETGWYTFYDDTEFEIACSRPDYDPDAFAAFVSWLGTIISDHIPQPYRKNKQSRQSGSSEEKQC